MKVVFIIQAEGRGHLTQAISLYQLLKKNGHDVSAMVIGGSGKKLPSFFTESVKTEILSLKTPFLVFKNRELSLLQTTWMILRNIGLFIKNLRFLHTFLKAQKPDLIINFYESFGGLHQFLYKPVAPMICVGHQYLLLHKAFEHPDGWFQRFVVNANTRFTAMGAAKKLALSFDECPNDGDLIVVPPLLRVELFELQAETKDFLLAYVTNPALADEIVAWQARNLSVKIEGFWEKPSRIFNENMVFNEVNGALFLEKMRTCKGVVMTAGFESVCEAMLLGKPAMLMPVPNHYEQACNAKDAVRAGAGMRCEQFEFEKFIALIPDYQPVRNLFLAWSQKAEAIFIQEINKIPTVQTD